jgi:sugar phosphate isomerase/epimerase
MAALAAVAAAEGVTVCVEDLPRSCLGNASAELADILSADPRLRVCFDVNHLLKESHADFLRTLGPQIVATHISDYDFVDERHWLPGEGRIDWHALADALDAAGYDGAWNYELSFSRGVKGVDRPRDLTPADIVRNAREIEERRPVTVLGRGGLPDLPMGH